MSKLKSNLMKLEHKKVVSKHKDSGRCYNFVEGLGWNHYTKGFRKHSSNATLMEKGTMLLFSFLDRINPKEEVKVEGE